MGVARGGCGWRVGLTGGWIARKDRAMRYIDSWTAFLVMLFAIVGLCGLFASYAASVPLERGLMRSALLDRAVGADAGQLEAMRPALGTLAGAVVDGAGPIGERVAGARLVVADEQRREAASVNYRVRLMLGVVTVIAAVLGAGLMSLTRKAAAQEGGGAVE